MSITNLGVLSHLIATTPAMTLGGLSARSIDPNLQLLVDAADGDVDPTFVAVQSGRPTIGFTTRSLKTFLDNCGIAGCEVAAMDAYFRAIEKYGTRKTGLNHTKVAVATGMMIPRTLSAQQDQIATMAADILAISSDGATVPVVPTNSQALPANSDEPLAWTVGPVSINGAGLSVQGITVDFGLQVMSEGSDGDAWPTFVSIMARRPVIRLTTPEMLALTTFSVDGTAQGVTDSVVYFRKMADGGVRVADNVAEHISFTMDDGLITCGPITGGQGQRIGTEVILTPIYDGTNAIIVINTTSTIV